MNILYQHLLNHIEEKPHMNELSEKLFQLGHEHELENNIFKMELTPNRGDCLSLRGLLRDLRSFYNIKIDEKIYQENLLNLKLKFQNNIDTFCPRISFLKVEIENIPKFYNEQVESFFSELNNKKNNFFTDISNYLSYETGQPTHCYKLSAVKDNITLGRLNSEKKFQTLLDRSINLKKGEIVFLNHDNEVINLAGIIGGKNSACDNNTKSVLIECAYFNSEMIIGNALKHSINSDAAHKFERNTDPSCHDYVLRRFLKIIEDHTNIISAEIYTERFIDIKKIIIKYDIQQINKILGTNIDNEMLIDCMSNLGFEIIRNEIYVPDHRHDIKSINDIAEEVARVIGYDNIKPKSLKIISNGDKNLHINQEKIRSLLVNNGFYEVINNPFVSYGDKFSIEVDNPLDITKKYLRKNLKDSLLMNLLYNERRQKDSIKLFEISDIYSSESIPRKRVLGIIASGRLDNNYEDFTKKINTKYITNLLNEHGVEFDLKNYENISRESLNSKSKEQIIYLEIEISSSFTVNYNEEINDKKDYENFQYTKISEYPSSKRDLSFSISEFENSQILQDYILNFENELLKQVFIFDYFCNEKNKEIKIGFRFIFQDSSKTITEKEVNKIISVIIINSTKIKGITIPGITY